MLERVNRWVFIINDPVRKKFEKTLKKIWKGRENDLSLHPLSPRKMAVVKTIEEEFFNNIDVKKKQRSERESITDVMSGFIHMTLPDINF